MIILLLVISLPLLEIASFITIGGDIGLGWSLLWIMAATIAGFHFLSAGGTQTRRGTKGAGDANAFPFEEMFDGLAILLGGILLIFPGFISDFLALPLLLPPIRGFIFRVLKYRHRHLFDNLSRNAEGFTHRYYGERQDGQGRTTTIIEGDFKRVEDDKNLPKQ